jgi:pyruvate dehydrogenase E1 component beta subunit
MPRILKYSEAINDALHVAMSIDDRVICCGLGVPDPRGIFGTTTGLREKFGSERVFDTPTAENGMTGVAVGAALTGLRPVMTHQRLDFFLLAMDQLVNNAAKWHYTYGNANVPITIRLIIGRGWGQGPTHSQSLHAWFAHIPGLKVIMPAFASDAKGLLLSSIFDNNPVVFLEHRWLHHQQGDVPTGDYRVPIGKAAILREGRDITLVGMSYMSIEALRAADCLCKQGIDCEVVDLRTISPLDWNTVFQSVKKTGRVIALDTSWVTGSVSGEIIARVSTECWTDLKQAPQRLGLPDFPIPASPALTRDFYPEAKDIVRLAGQMMGKPVVLDSLEGADLLPHDVPGAWFKGPF